MAKALTSAQRRTFRTRNKIRRVNIDRVGARQTRPRLSVHARRKRRSHRRGKEPRARTVHGHALPRERHPTTRPGSVQEKPASGDL